MFITYDLRQSENTRKPVLVRGAKEAKLPGPLIRWEVGAFEGPSGRRVYGVKILHSEKELSTVIEIPANAENVHVHDASLPKEYDSALKTAI